MQKEAKISGAHEMLWFWTSGCLFWTSVSFEIMVYLGRVFS